MMPVSRNGRPNPPWQRRGAFGTVAALLLATLIAGGCGGGASTSGAQKPAASAAPGKVPDLKGHNLTYVSFGGDLQAAESAVFLKPFASLSGLNIVQDSPIDYSKLKVQVQTGNVQWNVAHADTFFVDQNCGKLFEPLDTSAVDLKTIRRQFVTNRCGMPFDIFAWYLVYDAQKFGGDPPTSWADFFDTKKYPGKRCIWNFVQTGALEAALLADGVKRSELYPLDLDRAFRKLDTIKQDIVWGATPSQATQAMLQGNATMCITNQVHLVEAVREGAKWKAVTSGSIRTWDNLAIVKGTQDTEAADALLSYAAQPKVQVAFRDRELAAPTSVGAKPSNDPVFGAVDPTAPRTFKAGVAMDQHYWAANFDMLNQRWTEWQAG